MHSDESLKGEPPHVNVTNHASRRRDTNEERLLRGEVIVTDRSVDAPRRPEQLFLTSGLAL
jgi:hypothetical protein